MHLSILHAIFIAFQAACVYALPKLQAAEALELVSFTPTNPISGWPTTNTTTSISSTGTSTDGSISWKPTEEISGWPHSSSSSALSSISYLTTKPTQVITATTITVTDNSITWTPTQSVSGWPPSSKTQTAPGQQLTETFTITYTSYSEETISLPLSSSVNSSTVQSATPPFTVVTVTASPTSLATASTTQSPFTIVTVTATPTSSGTPRLTTVTVSEVTIQPTPTTTQSITHTPQVVTLTLTLSSINWSLNTTAVSYSSTVMTLNPPPTFATGTATGGNAGDKRHI
ncbi:hypothetical protein F5B18DRAFT_668970 [Nemania serpens]|nr:hypothetical protein F5B18DRAFT_668970 [Nemania serpens]